jgi:2-polyprenyl-3-methyl-5-hydroxy-6-metoxy-1,4-benzoquinol methylase
MGTDGSRAPSTARDGVVWSVLSAELAGRGDAGAEVLDVLDLGGGSGVAAVPVAELGHRVTVVDTSADALATLQRRAADAGVADRVAAVQGEVERLPGTVGAAAYDLVLCHSLLEVVDDPAATLATVAGALRPGGCASVLAAGRAAAVLARALGGHLAAALRALTDPTGRWGDADAVLRRFETDQLLGLVTAAGLRVEAVHGVRVVADLVPGTVLDAEPGAAGALRELEAAAAARPPYRDLAAQLHVLARR